MGHLFSKKDAPVDARMERMNRLLQYSRTPEQLERSKTLIENQKRRQTKTKPQSRHRSTSPGHGAGAPARAVEPEFQEARHVADHAHAEPWFHYGLTNADCDALLMSSKEGSGTFVVRSGVGPQESFILSVLHRARVYNWRIVQRRDGSYILGEDRPDALAHASVRDLLEYHMDNPLPLTKGGSVRLDKYISYEDRRSDSADSS